MFFAFDNVEVTTGFQWHDGTKAMGRGGGWGARGKAKGEWR